MAMRNPLGHLPASARVWPYISAAIGVVLVLGLGIAIFDTHGAMLQREAEELDRLRSHAERSAGQIENQFLENPDTNLKLVCKSPWLRRYWKRNVPRQTGRLYAAVTDPRGLVVAHTYGNREGLQVAPEVASVPSATNYSDEVLTNDPVLTPSRKAIDIRVPIYVDGDVVGMYHSGMDEAWLKAVLSQELRMLVVFWGSVIGAIGCVVLASSVSIVHVTRQTSRLENELELANARRTMEMHELVLGIAHEIRNPLNAIGLNIHTIDQVFHHAAELPAGEIDSMLRETTSEIARLEGLMREMLGFARQAKTDAESVDLADEVQRTVRFLKQKFEDADVAVHIELAPEISTVSINRTRLRQVLLNLLNNACDEVGSGGRIEVTVRQQREQIEVVVADDGPGIALADCERVFVPFYSTKPSGTGLGLALARKHIEEAGGTIVCEPQPQRTGSRFKITMPAKSGAILETVL
jgi:signal transduction histidine kinase